MKTSALCFLGTCGLLLGSAPASAVVCHLEDEPAATLLLPYFEVDLSTASGITTLMSINNSDREGQAAHVEIWSDLAVPMLGFDIYLKAFDVQTINLRDVLLNGSLPQTGPAPAEHFPGCAGLIPPPPLTSAFVQHLQRSLMGKSSLLLLGGFAGRNLGDNLARGYVTVDVINDCASVSGKPSVSLGPADEGYFAPGGTGVASNWNALWGDYFYINPAQNYGQGETLVHIQADGRARETSAPGNYTFYGRYVGWTAADNREPLATNFAVRFLTGGPFSGGTSLIVWRDPKVDQKPLASTIRAGNPTWYPLGAEQIVARDEETAVSFLEAREVFPAATQKVHVNDPVLPVPFRFGWLELNLNTAVFTDTNPPEDRAASQAWVTTVMDANGMFSVGFDAVQLDSACVAKHR